MPPRFWSSTARCRAAEAFPVVVVERVWHKGEGEPQGRCRDECHQQVRHQYRRRALPPARPHDRRPEHESGQHQRQMLDVQPLRMPQRVLIHRRQMHEVPRAQPQEERQAEVLEHLQEPRRAPVEGLPHCAVQADHDQRRCQVGQECVLHQVGQQQVVHRERFDRRVDRDGDECHPHAETHDAPPRGPIAPRRGHVQRHHRKGDQQEQRLEGEGSGRGCREGHPTILPNRIQSFFTTNSSGTCRSGSS